MKKKLFTLILCLLAAVTASARYGIDEVAFGGHALYLTNQNWTKYLSQWDDPNDSWEGIGGRADWDYATRTLTLTDLWVSRMNSPFSSTTKTGMWIEASQDINVVIKGDCQVFTGTGSALLTYGNISLTGNGTLKLTGSEAAIEWGTSNTTLTVYGPTITLCGAYKGSQMLGTNDKTCTLDVAGGSIKFTKAVSDEDRAYAISKLKSVAMATDIGITTPHGGYFATDGYLHDVDGSIVRGMEARIGAVTDYGFKVLGKRVNSANYDVITQFMTRSKWLTKGSVSYDPSARALVLNKCELKNNNDPGYPTIENISNDGLKIKLIGTSSIVFKNTSSDDNLMLKLRANTTIVAAGESGQLGPYRSKGGIFVAGGTTLTFDGSNDYLSVWPTFIEGGGNGGTIDYKGRVDLTINDGKSTGTVRNIRFKKKMPIMSSEAAPRFIWNRTDGTPGVYQSRTALATGKVRFVDESNDFINYWKYKVKIGDEYIHEYNKNYFVSGIVTNGYLTWDNSTKVLTLHNATIETDADVAIELGEEATINLIGQNTIKCNSQNNPLAIFVSNSKPLTIQEDATSSGGSLTITSNAAGGSILVNNTLTVNSKLTVPELYADLLELNNCEVKVTRLMHSNASSNLYDIPVRLNGVIVASSEASPAYYNPTTGKVVMKNGTVKFVKKTSDTTVRGLTFCGIPIDDNNKDFIWTEQLQSGTVKYDKANKQIKLIGAVINNKTENHAFEFNGFTGSIYTQGSNTIHCTNANSRSLYLDNASTIDLRCPTDGSTGHMLYATGTDGSTTSAGSFFVGESCKLSKNDNSSHLYVNVPHIHGMNTSSAPSTLYVGSAYLTVTGNTKKGTVRNIKCQVGPNAELYSVASNPLVIDNEVGICAEGGGLYTGEVKFVKKGESYIIVVDISLDKYQLTFTKKGETAQLTATCLPADATNQTITWESTNESVATVDQNGVVIAKGKGSTFISASCDGLGSACQVTVNIPDPTSIKLNRTSYIFESESVSAIFISAILTPAGADYDDIVWTSSDESIAYIVPSSIKRDCQVVRNRDGKDGTCIITAKTPNGLTATCQITVRLHPTYIEEILFDVPDEVHMKTIGETFTITPTILPANATDKKIRWWSNTEDNVRVDSVDQKCIVTAKNYGGSVVFCFAEDGSGVYKSIRVYVDRPPVLATGIEIDPQLRFPNTFYALGEQYQLKATITPVYATNKTVRWESDDESVATVDENGLVTITGWGSCHVTASTTDGSNLTSEPCYIDSQDPSTIWEPVPGYALRLDQKEVTFFRGEAKEVIINTSPANFNGHIYYEPLEDLEEFNNVLASVDVNYGENNMRYLTVATDANFPRDRETGTVHVRVYIDNEGDIDREKLRELGYPEDYVPADTITVHVVDPVMFTAKSVDGIDVTYRVPSLDGNECEVYADYEEGKDWDDELLDYACTPAVSVNASGKLTIPSKVTDPSSGKEFWVTNVTTHAFMQCSKLTEIEFGEGITSIDRWACHRRMFALTKVTLPSSIQILGQQCFAANANDYMQTGGYGDEEATGFSNLREVYIKAFTPPTGPYMDWGDGNGEYMPIGDAGAFDMIAEDAVLYVPIGAKDNYSKWPWISGWVVDEYWDEGGYEAEGWFSRIEEFDFFGNGNDEDAIKDIKDTNDLNDSWYDLSGRLISKPTMPGVYIRNGKKIVIK